MLGPIAPIQQFNQDTWNGPICCDVTPSGSGQASASTASADILTTDEKDDNDNSRKDDSADD